MPQNITGMIRLHLCNKMNADNKVQSRSELLSDDKPFFQANNYINNKLHSSLQRIYKLCTSIYTLF